MDTIGAGMAVAAVPVVLLMCFAFGFWVKYRRRIEERRLTFEAQKLLLDKIGSSQEAIQFLSSKEGRELFARLNPPENHIDGAGWKPGTRTPIAVVKETTTWGLGIFGIGAGIIIADRLFNQTGYLIWGCILTLSGTGLLIAAGISYRLSKELGIIRKEGESTAVKQTSE